MARLKGWKGSGKSTAIKTGLQVYINRGALVASSWPKKRGRPKSAITREQNEWFRQANLAAKYADDQAQWMAIEISRGSPWYPRDILISAMAGRLFETLNIDGVEFRSMAVNEDVSSDLDFLAGTLKGTIIVRGDPLWGALLPGPVGYILTSKGPDELPAYVDPGNPGGRSLVHNTAAQTFSSFAVATKGIIFRPLFPFSIHSMGARINATDGHVYRGSLFEVDAGFTISALIGETVDVIATATVVLNMHRDLPTPPLLDSTKNYTLVWSRRDGADTFALPSTNGDGSQPVSGLPSQPFNPIAGLNPNATLAKAQPAVGDTFGTSVAGGYYTTALISF